MSGLATERDVAAVPVERPGAMGKLEATRRELARYQFWLELARILSVEITLASALVFADWVWVLPATIRGSGLVAMIGLAVLMLLRSHRPIDRAAAAVGVEDQFPELGQRLRTVVQYAEPAPDAVLASPGLIEALGRDTDRRTSTLDFRKLVPWASLERRAVAFVLASAVGIVALLVSPGLRIATLRMLLLPLHYTALAVEPGDVTLKAGEELKLEISLTGRPVDSASWSYRKRDGDGQWMTTSLAEHRPDDKPNKPLIGALSARLKDCRTDFDYRVVAGEVESRTFHVKVLHPLLMRGIEATVTPPPYTRRPAEVIKEGDFRAIEGSRIQIVVMLDRAPRTAALVWGSPDDPSRTSIPLKRDGARLTGELPPIAKEVQYEIAAADGEGMKLDAGPYRVKVQADEKPTIRFILPEESLAVTPIAEVPIQVEAGDDFGVARLGITYKIGDGPAETLHLASLENQPVTAEALATLYLEKHKLSFTDAITYYAFVEDNYPARAHRVATELRYIDILPYKQAYQLVEGGGTCDGTSLTLEELIARQRVNLNRTFAFENDRTLGDETARRLAKFEQELAALTAEFADGMAAIAGPISALEEAVTAMRSATELLTAKDVTAARPREEAALKGLIGARLNLRKLLKQSNSSRAGACRSCDAKQFQGIRRPAADQAKELTARLARQRDLAQAIARAERELGKALGRKAESKEGRAHDDRQLAEKQSELAEEVAVLADVLKQLKMAAAEEQPELARSIGRATRTNPPEEVGELLRRNAIAIGKGRTVPAAQSADRAAGQLDALAQDLESIRRSAIQPQLERLLAAEKQAAALRERLRSVKQASRKAEAEKAISDFARDLDKLASDEGALRQAADKLASATQSGVGGWTRNDKIEPGYAGYLVPPMAYTESLRVAILSLQGKIQEIMLENAPVERNGPVPPQYKDLVEDYYRILSQDLR